MTRTIDTRGRAGHAPGLLVMLAIAFAASTGGAAPDFSRDVRPLLEQHCLKCHGPEKQKGGLRFDTREGAFQTAESGEKAILPGVNYVMAFSRDGRAESTLLPKLATAPPPSS